MCVDAFINRVVKWCCYTCINTYWYKLGPLKWCRFLLEKELLWGVKVNSNVCCKLWSENFQYKKNMKSNNFYDLENPGKYFHYTPAP